MDVNLLSYCNGVKSKKNYTLCYLSVVAIKLKLVVSPELLLTKAA